MLSVEDTVTLAADESLLAQLLQNLFANAVDHAGPDVTVTVGTIDDGDGFFVADDGPGIPLPERDHVFEAGVSSVETGMGLGLAIVSQVARVHDWTVHVDESAAGGARDSKCATSTWPRSGVAGASRGENHRKRGVSIP